MTGRKLLTGRFAGEPKYLEGFIALLAVAFSVSTFLRHPGFNVWLDGFLYAFISFGTAVACVERWRRSHNEDRRAWLSFGFGLAMWSIGQAMSGELTVRHIATEGPSIADGFWLSSYLFLYAGILMLTRTRLREVPKSIWFDGLVSGLSAAGIVAAFVFEPIMHAIHGSAFSIAVSLTYPCADLLLLALVICTFALSGWRPDRSWLLLGGGLILFAASDTGYLYAAAKGLVPDGTPMDIPWTAGLVAMSLAPWRKVKVVNTQAFEKWPVIAIPMIFACLSLGTLSIDRFVKVPPIAIFLALASIAAGMARLCLTFREVRLAVESRRQARTDDLTELANRRYIHERAQMALHGRAKDNSLALLLIDLDKFKEVNDTLGHDHGDSLLKQLAARLKEITYHQDVVARLGGDEFAILIEGADKNLATKVANKILMSLEKPFEVDEVSIRIGASVGIACFPKDGEDMTSLLKHADVAMYTAKRDHSGIQEYESETDEHTRERLRSINELRDAIENDQLVVYYQAKVAAATGDLVGAEALVRLRHPERGILAPWEFLPLAESAGLMKLLTGALLRLVIADLRDWSDQGLRVNVAVNLSVTNLLDADLPDSIAATLAEFGVDGSLLTFEITEDTVISDPLRTKSQLDKLKALGGRISLDDYGTGYASLAYLRELPFDEMKLDRSFINDFDKDPVSHVFVTTAVQLAHVLGLKVVAEGIETEEMWRAAAGVNVDICQGYLFARPVARNEFETLPAFTASKSIHVAPAS